MSIKPLAELLTGAHQIDEFNGTSTSEFLYDCGYQDGYNGDREFGIFEDSTAYSRGLCRGAIEFADEALARVYRENSWLNDNTDEATSWLDD